MVVLSAALCNNEGKALLSRQFVEISKGKIEGLLTAFSNFLDPNSETNYIETENTRYLYLPLESMYVLLLTTLNSNIIEDLETLSLIGKIIPEYCESLDELDIKQNIYDLLLAIDEVITSGYKEKLTISQLKQLTDMESNEEKIHEIIERNKLIEMREIAKKRQKEIEQEKKEIRSKSKGTHYPQTYDIPSTFESDHIYVHEREKEKKREEENKPLGKASMKLRKEDNKFSQYLKEMEKAGELSIVEPPKSSSSSSSSQKQQLTVPQKEVHIDIIERISLTMKSDGRIENFEVNGTFSLNITNPDLCRLRIQYHSPSKSQFQFRGHPHLNKQKVSQNILELKSPEKSFPLNSPLEVLKWRFQSKEDTDVPLIISCWPTQSGDVYTINMEYELTATFLELNNVQILVPIPQGYQPVVESNDGTYEFHHKTSTLIWNIPVIDVSNNSGAMEFTVPFSGKPYVFYPILVDFMSTKTFSQIAIDSITNISTDEEVDYSHVISFSPTEHDYKIEY